MNMIKKNTASRLDKVRALLVVGEEDGGSEIVQTVIVLGFAVGLGGCAAVAAGATSKPPSRKREPR